MQTPTDVRGLSGAEYAKAKRELLAASPARPKPATAADRPDIECVDVRTVSTTDYINRKSAFLAHWST